MDERKELPPIRDVLGESTAGERLLGAVGIARFEQSVDQPRVQTPHEEALAELAAGVDRGSSVGDRVRDLTGLSCPCERREEISANKIGDPSRRVLLISWS